MPKLDFDLARFAEGFAFVVHAATVPDLQATTKPEAIREMVGALVKAGAIPAASQEGVVAAILKREQLGSTAVGNGVAIPHAKHEAVSRVVGNTGWSRQGINFDSLDGKKVHLLVLLVSPLDRAGDHLRAPGEYLAAIANASAAAGDPIIGNVRTPAVAKSLEQLASRNQH